MAMDFSNDKSIFLQVARMIENEILRDILREDEQSLSTHELARLHNINPNTAAKSLSTLMTEGILYKKRGVGMFVANGAKEKILTKRRAEFLGTYIKPLLHEAKVMGIDKAEIIKLITEEDV